MLTSGLHSPLYFDKMRVLSNPEVASRLLEELAGKLRGYEIAGVIGPALGGVVIAFEVAKILNVPCAFADRKGEGRIIRPEGIFPPSTKVAIVDDILTTGKSLRETMLTLRDLKVEVIGVLLDRSGGEVNLGVPLMSLASLKVEAHKPEECPLCQKGIPLEVLGGSQR